MSSFTTPLRVEALDDGERWKILEPFVYELGEKGSGKEIRIPVGFVTDFASIPKVFWSVVGAPWGTYGKAAVLHDYLYATQPCPRARADEIFLEAMSVLGVDEDLRQSIYSAVRLGGAAAWKAHKTRHNLA